MIAAEDDKPTIRPRNDKSVIKLEDVTRIYKVGVERIHALDGINLELKENEYVAVMGTSGSGKSTLMNVLGCLDRAIRLGLVGFFFLDGIVDFPAMDRDALRRRDSQPHLVTPHIDDGDLDLVPNHDGLVFLSAQNQHR